MGSICQAALIAKHILIECTYLTLVRYEYYKENNIKKLFETVEIDKIIFYLTAVNVYKKIER